MALTKKEKAHIESLEEEIILLRALCRTPEVYPDVPFPITSDVGTLSKGYFFNAYTLEVSPACSSSVSHSVRSDTHTTSQGAIHLYSSRKLAYQAMRNVVEKHSASRLATIDAFINLETINEPTTPT